MADGWMKGWINREEGGWMEGRRDVWMNARMQGRKDGWMNRETDDGWIDGQMDK